MKSPAASHVKSKSRGFTLVELLLVISMMLVVGVFMFPLGISFYRSQMVNEAAEGIESALRRAETYSITHKHDSSFGVKFLGDSYVFFQGDSYALREAVQDELYLTAANISGSVDEVVFEAFSGLPSATGTILVTSGDKNAQVEIDSIGRIQ